LDRTGNGGGRERAAGKWLGIYYIGDRDRAVGKELGMGMEEAGKTSKKGVLERGW